MNSSVRGAQWVEWVVKGCRKGMQRGGKGRVERGQCKVVGKSAWAGVGYLGG